MATESQQVRAARAARENRERRAAERVERDSAPAKRRRKFGERLAKSLLDMTAEELDELERRTREARRCG